jgi:hypothetical protein
MLAEFGLGMLAFGIQELVKIRMRDPVSMAKITAEIYIRLADMDTPPYETLQKAQHYADVLASHLLQLSDQQIEEARKNLITMAEIE